MPEYNESENGRNKVELNYNYSNSCGSMNVFLTPEQTENVRYAVRRGEGFTVTNQMTAHTFGPGVVYRIEVTKYA
jgi:hypothetical protein